MFDRDLVVLFTGVLGPLLLLLMLLYGLFYLAKRGFDLAGRGVNVQAYLPPVFWISLTGILVFTAISITAFELIANSYRFAGPTSQELPDDDRARFLAQSRNAFFMVYVGVVLASGLAGSLLQRWTVRKGRVTSVALVAAVVVLLILSIPNVEYWNSCYVGESFIIEDTPRCS